jgi:hypothetical protein
MSRYDSSLGLLTRKFTNLIQVRWTETSDLGSAVSSVIHLHPRAYLLRFPPALSLSRLFRSRPLAEQST